MRTLPKHLRPRWRYLGLAIETWPNARIDRRSFQAALWDAARGLLGDPGSADCDLTVVRLRFDDERGTGDAIVRVRREDVHRGRAALACVAAVGDYPVGLVVRGTSGTIRACEERLRHPPKPESGAETTVWFSSTDRSTADRSAEDRSAGDRAPVSRLAVEKSGGRFDVSTKEGGEEGFVGATALDVETETRD